ncbi:alpha/beta fold hydrolase [Crateriforma conspicua]|uniref:Pimeloyl-[acyl-carrier protein] methyl ester esterase n=1 Tax=Crateriforma conspicua TaxID=2527996 RepID=A0A5C6FQG1_9PLAN|nr:alpha/beta hydrolase [Crateriforma conspicua]TWU62736.1 Pimeloyl-[acyl-carrier protein] methyl ester esterase [Crateriforma conspicua]
MRSTVLMISGWSYGAGALAPLAQRLPGNMDSISLSAEEVLTSDRMDRSLRDDRRYILVGWSMGGMLALHWLARQPNLFKAMVLVGSTAKFSSGDGHHDGVPKSRLRAMSLGLQRDPTDVLARFDRLAAEPHPVHPTVTECRQANEPSTDLDAKQRDETLAAGLRFLSSSDFRPLLATVTVPTLILHGEDDEVIPARAATEMAHRIKDSHLEFRAQIGHDLPVRDPTWVAERIEQFWTSDEADGNTD